jgi:competence protein ComGC
MRNSGPTNGAGSGRDASTTNHPIVARALESIGIIARITRVRGVRGLVLAEKSGAGWARRSAGRGRQAFTRVELCACLAAGALLVLLALPALATSQSRGHVAQCLNNLRLMGRAVHVWAGDYQNQPPWQTLQQDGGLMPASGTRQGLAWFDLAFMSNALVTPRILACPADRIGVMAKDFGDYITPTFRNNATSYILNLHSLSGYPEGLLFADWNMKLNAGAQACATRVNNVASFSLQAGSGNGWTNKVVSPNNLHGFSGNIAVMDGSVSETTSEQLRAAMAKPPDENGSDVHLLKPR